MQANHIVLAVISKAVNLVNKPDGTAAKHRTSHIFTAYHRLAFRSTFRHWLIYLFSALSVTRHSITVLSFAIIFVAILTRPFCRRFRVSVLVCRRIDDTPTR